MPGAPKPSPSDTEVVDVDALLGTYRAWLGRQSLAARSREAYAAQVLRFLTWLVSSEHGARALSDSHVRDWAVRDYKRHVKTQARWAPSSVNQALAAIDNFYRSLGAGRPEVPREDLPQLAPRAL
ncbi:MAG: phage integrase N-terminal SAM-like domain-containing protein, partial [Solirubrobacteraceae bacterium]